MRAAADQEPVVAEGGLAVDLGLQPLLLLLALALAFPVVLAGVARSLARTERPVGLLGHRRHLHAIARHVGEDVKIPESRPVPAAARRTGLAPVTSRDGDVHCTGPRRRYGGDAPHPRRSKGGTAVLTRLIGSDAVVEFSDDLLELVKRVEATFPAPEWAVLFNDAEEEDEADEIVVCRRYSGVLMPISYVDLDEIEEMENDGFDWLADLAADLARTDEQIEADIAAEEAAGEGEGEAAEE